MKSNFRLSLGLSSALSGALSLVLSGCNYNDAKNLSQPGSKAGGESRTNPEASVDFASVKQLVFEPACIKCHGATVARSDVRVDDYASAFASLDAIRAEVAGGTMPPPPPRGSTLSVEQKALLMAWIESGGPEHTLASPPATPAPASTPAPSIAPDFAMVSTSVFQPHCVKCHGSAATKGGVNLEVYASALRHVIEIRTSLDTDDMPRRAPALPPDLKAIVYAWLDAGAPETVIPGPVVPGPALP